MVNCPVCGNEVPDPHRIAATDVSHIECPVCGDYRISGTAITVLEGESREVEGKRYLLSGVLRQASDRGDELLVRSDNISDLIGVASPPRDPIDSIDRVLLHVHTNLSEVSDWVQLEETDYPLIFAHGPDEFSFICNHAVEQDYLQWGGESAYRLTLRGWERVRRLRTTGSRSDQAFVAMWFTKDLVNAWTDGFRPALESTGYEPVRMDLIEHNERIDDRILAEIRGSGLLVADFTGNRGGVYFEAGFALGLEIPVIWTCREDQVDALHFDTRQFNHVTWESPEDLAEKLKIRIRATIPGRAKRRPS